VTVNSTKDTVNIDSAKKFANESFQQNLLKLP